MPPRSSAPGCWSCAVSCAVPAGAGSRCGRPAPGTSARCTTCGGPRGWTPCTPRSTGCPSGSATRPTGPMGSEPGDGAHQRVPDVAVRRHQAGRRLHGHRHRRGGPQAVAPQPRERRMSPPRPRVGGHGSPPRTSYRRPHRGGLGRRPRAARRPTAGEQQVLDIGGGTGGFAVRVAAQGNRITVVDPSPDALAALARRADEEGVADRVTGLQGDLGNLRRAGARGRCRPGAVPRRARSGRRPCRGAADDRLGAAARRRPLPAGQPAARRRARPGDGRPLHPGHGRCSRATRPRPADRWASTGSPPRRSPTCSAAPGSPPTSTHGIRVFTDLVPSSLLDLEPGASAALLELERAVSERPEYLTLASQLHVVATR